MYYYIENYLGAYLHQDYDIIHGDDEGAFKDFLLDNGASGIKKELNELSIRDDDYIDSILSKSNFLYKNKYISGRMWIYHMLNIIQDSALEK